MVAILIQWRLKTSSRIGDIDLSSFLSEDVAQNPLEIKELFKKLFQFQQIQKLTKIRVNITLVCTDSIRINRPGHNICNMYVLNEFLTAKCSCAKKNIFEKAPLALEVCSSHLCAFLVPFASK